MARTPRRWIKVFCYETLHGSVSYQLSEAEQAVWVKLLCLAGLCGNEGVIADHDLRPYPHTFIMHEIHTDEDVFKSTLAKCKEEGRISEDGRGIVITNWTKYQSEYERQKPFREAKKRRYEVHQFSPEESRAINEENERRLAVHQSMRGK